MKRFNGSRHPTLYLGLIIASAILFFSFTSEPPLLSSPAGVSDVTAKADAKSTAIVTTQQPGSTFTNSIGMKFVKVPKGTFWMSKDEKNAQKQVKIEQDFYMGIYEVTQGQWQAVMGKNPSCFSRTGRYKDSVKNIPDKDLVQLPVEEVSWQDTQEFIKKLNKKVKESGWVYRLPSEAEWDYACRGGANSKQDCHFDFYFTNPTSNLSSRQANFDGNRPFGKASKGPNLQRTIRVGSYQPNALGIYDMHGNVWEWCQNEYVASSGVLRGGCWGSPAVHCRVASRYRLGSVIPLASFGFRLVAVPSGK